jgi:hypothetical protein
LNDQRLDNIFSQIGHFLGAYAAVLTLVLFNVHYWLLISLIGVTAWASFKEFYIDAKYEDPAIRGSDMEDFLFYMLGLVVGIGIVFLARKL